MRFQSPGVDLAGVQDRRGIGGFLLGGGGALGLVALVLYLLLGGGGTSSSDSGSGDGQVSVAGGETPADLQQRCDASGAVDTYTDCRMIKIYDVINSTWSDEFARRGLSYQRPGLVFFSDVTSTGCGEATADVGPFYCPQDRDIYLDLGFLAQLEEQYGIKGHAAEAYIEAHEAGHHIQTLLGTMQKVEAEEQADPDQANALSVRLELQADCYAGVWAKLSEAETNKNGIVLTASDVDDALNAAAAVGDDRIQKASGETVNPEQWTHGSSRERAAWLQTGLSTGDMNACDTFGN